MNQPVKYIIIILLFLQCVEVKAQTSWPSPEIEQMYNQARQYLSQGNLPQAINTYKQAIRIAPDQMVLYRDLGKAYYLSGNYTDAQHTLEPLLKSKEADEQSFQIMAACQSAADEKKKAKNIIQDGLERFPNSGILYHELGKIYEDNNEPSTALKTWLTGIQKDPIYHMNYYEATRLYTLTNRPVWVILYGEIFVNIERHTARADEVREMIMKAYTRVFNSISNSEIPEYGKGTKENEATSFENAVRNTLLQLSPVISDGINTENLTMLRTRFLMEWFSKYANQYPFSLFRYQENMTRNGYFEIYNEWLFGKADNVQAYEAWNKFHPDDMKSFEAWAKIHALQPGTTDFYNDMNVDNIFGKKKK